MKTINVTEYPLCGKESTKEVVFPHTNRDKCISKIMKRRGFKKAIVFADGFRISTSHLLIFIKQIDMVEIPINQSPLDYYGAEALVEVLKIRKLYSE